MTVPLQSGGGNECGLHTPGPDGLCPNGAAPVANLPPADLALEPACSHATPPLVARAPRHGRTGRDRPRRPHRRARRGHHQRHHRRRARGRRHPRPVGGRGRQVGRSSVDRREARRRRGRQGIVDHQRTGLDDHGQSSARSTGATTGGLTASRAGTGAIVDGPRPGAHHHGRPGAGNAGAPTTAAPMITAGRRAGCPTHHGAPERRGHRLHAHGPGVLARRQRQRRGQRLRGRGVAHLRRRARPPPRATRST